MLPKPPLWIDLLFEDAMVMSTETSRYAKEAARGRLRV